MDLDLREAFDRGFGPEPPHRSISERIEAGHRAARRRRLVGTVVTAAAVAAIGLVAAIVIAGDSSQGDAHVATDPSTSAPTTTPTTAPTTAAPTQSARWPGDELARYTPDGAVQLG